MKKTFFVFYVIFFCKSISAQSGSPDPTFGNNGAILSSSGQEGSSFSTIAKQCFAVSDGKFIMVLQANNKAKLTRRLSDGSIDASFGLNGYSVVVSMYPGAAAIQSDGKVVVGGTTDGTTDFMLARYNADGSLDASFGNNGIVITDIGSTYDYLTSVLITPDSKIIAAGTTGLNGHGQFVLVRYDSSGMIDSSFGSVGITVTDFNNSPATLWSLTLQQDGKILAGGSNYNNGNGDFALARYNADGTPDLSFNLTGKATSDFSSSDEIKSLVVDGNGNIYAGGQSLDNLGYPHFTVARYTSEGHLDANFNGGVGNIVASFGNSFDNLTNIRLQSDGKVVAAGSTNLNPISNDIELIRINPNGNIDSSFGSNGDGLVLADIHSGYDESDYLLIQEDGRILTGGYSADFTSATPFTYTGFRFNSDGTPDAGFGSGGVFTDFVSGSNYNYNAVYLQSDGKVLAASESNSLTVNRMFLSRFNQDGTPDNSFGQNGTHELDFSNGVSFFGPDGKLLRVGYSFSVNGDADIMMLRYNADGSPDVSFGNNGIVTTDLGGSENAITVAFQPDGKFILGGQYRDNNGSDFLLIRYNANGTIDETFGTGGYVKFDYTNEDQVQTISLGTDGKIVFGGTSIQFAPDFSYFHFDGLIGRLNDDGSFDMSFGLQGKVIIDKSNADYIGTLFVQSDNKVVFTRFQSDDGFNTKIFMGRLNEDGSLDDGFGQTGDVACDGAEVFTQVDQKIIVVGNKLNNRNNLDYSLARFDQDGNADLSFGTNGKSIGSFTDLDNYFFPAIISGNNLFAGGNGVDVTGRLVGILAKFRLAAESSIICPCNQTVSTDSNLCSAKVYGLEPTVNPKGSLINYTLSGATTGSGTGSASGLMFNEGSTTVNYSLASDQTKSCTFTVTVTDNELPVIKNLALSQTTLWPANHKFVNVTVSYVASDNCGIANTQISVTSNEPIQSTESEDLSPDWQIIDNHDVRLRAERLDSGTGRIYTVTVTATDINGNQSSSIALVTVPKSMNGANTNLVVSAYPNPSSNYFLVMATSTSTAAIDLRLIDNRGSVLADVKNVRTQQLVKLGDNLRPGNYYIEVIQSGILRTIKVVKQ